MTSIDILWRLVRVPNLLIVAATQILVWFVILVPAYDSYGMVPYMDVPHVLLLVLFTVLVAAGGYVVNDLYDVELDKVNRPDSRIVGRLIHIQDTYRIYLLILLSGAFVAAYLSYELGKVRLFIVYPICAFTLWAYSKWFKRLPLSGNLIVSAFLALVPLLLLLPEWKNVLTPPFFTSVEHKLIWSLSAFAFGVTLLREFIKDIEDIYGDRKVGITTLAVILGPTRSTRWAIGFTFLLCSGFFLWLFLIYGKVSTSNIVYFCLTMLGTLLFILVLLFRAKHRKDYKQIRFWIKILILFGLGYVFFF